MPTIKDALRTAIENLARKNIETARLDAEVLLAHCLHQSRAWLFSHNTDVLSGQMAQDFTALVARRAAFEPVAYLIGEREFFGLPFIVTPSVLIPRPETEILVEHALADLPQNATFADVGTGSGCIAVACAKYSPTASGIATDISADAINIARQNIARHGVSARVSVLQCNLLDGVADKCDAILSNPPYVARDEWEIMPPDVKHFEPHRALFSANDGLAHIEKLLASVSAKLKPKGFILFEIGFSQGERALLLAKKYYPNAQFSILRDLAGKPRVLFGQF